MKIGPSNLKPLPAIVSEAAAWFIEFRAGDIDGDARESFIAWLRRSPEHILAYLEVAGAWAELPTSDPNNRIDVTAMIARARVDADIVTHPASPGRRALLKSASPGRIWRRMPRTSVLIAACFLVVLVALATIWEPM